MDTATRGRASSIRKIGWVAVASMLALAVLAPSAAPAFAVVDYATPFAHVDGDSDKNQETYWENLYGVECAKLMSGWTGNTWATDKAYGYVIVKVGSDQSVAYPNTVFKNVAAGKTVWPDSDGNNAYGTGDKDSISHIIVCAAATTTTTTTTPTTTTTTTSSTTTTTTTASTTTTTTSAVSGVTSRPSLPPSDMVAQPAASSDTWRMAIVAIALLLASALVIAPIARRGNR